MYRILDKFNGKQYGKDCAVLKEAQKIAEEHKGSVIVDMSISKETLKQAARNAWSELKNCTDKEEIIKLRRNWLVLDEQYTALYDEEY
ncbi:MULTISPECIES: hypothetical protein [Clostridia]|uniref:hypothetical protein n=1 Tax=Clostridia TaxID=186801 RepID=UPI000E52FB7C|nr:MULTISPECIES: hypothetical protein [Clostridia]RHV70209.1 hypothetical protein DXB15_07875 [Roseburia sp. OM02-15]